MCTRCVPTGDEEEMIYIFLIKIETCIECKINSQRIEREENLKLLNFVHTDDKILKICFLYFQSIRRNGYYYTRSNCTRRIPRRTLVVLHTCKKPHFCTNYSGSTHTSNSKNVIFYCLFHRWIGVAVVQAFDTLSRVLPTVQYGFQILGLCHQQQPVSDSHFAQ